MNRKRVHTGSLCHLSSPSTRSRARAPSLNIAVVNMHSRGDPPPPPNRPRNKHTTLGACPASPYAALDVRAFRELVLLRQWTRLNKCCVQMLSTFSFFQTKDQIFFDLDCFSILPYFRYCSMLPSDRFTHLSPVYKIEEVEEDGKKSFKCELELPINCQLRRTICVSANKITVLTLVS